ncbi:DNA polymerase alpha subunit B [Marchantia polymorpha subsp. ruderalis]|uniref:DNA polymerase alpha subunit B n=2 Tax=Marchantia polymorpha TaxID=3197 RepID=A0A176WFN3_MARPO|nr:hypothetical protein AXG93_4031s1480 [Marchantia polymorpha subsp. ruderalis]PTQ41325.1 hypothetical protein MARPO_0035s0099 [Marchantia polymorpha]BBN13404.1 hypothetical protein Mp_6g03190 [Marchantia polymorpha subsp. ruderalis]|eukprot:PTQ41325.1 hypothetical protein MARPO_0035s0099 [Marchantia polymorpha]
MDRAPMVDALREEFRDANFDVEDDTVLEQCASLCVVYSFKPADLVSSWEVFYLNRQMNEGKVSVALLPKFKSFLQEEQREALRSKPIDGLHSFSTIDDVDMLLNDKNDEGELQETPPTQRSTSKKDLSPGAFRGVKLEAEFAALIGPKTPKTPAGPFGKSSSEGPRPKSEDSPLTPFAKRPNKCAVQTTYNAELKEPVEERIAAGSEDDVLRRLRPIERCQIEVLSPSPKVGCRFMFDRIEDRFLATETRLKKFANALAASEGCKVSSNGALASQEQIMVVGRICCEGEGHLNDKSVLLEGSVEFCGGQRVRLDLRNISQLSLFPGQVVGVEGQNPSGHCLVASRLVDSIPCAARSDPFENQEPVSKRRVLSQNEDVEMESTTQHPVTLVTAAGPYTATDNLLFEPLTDLLSHARRKRPRLLLLIGPFVDSDHSMIKEGLVNRTYEQIFKDEIKSRIEDYCQEMGDGARVLLVPSTRDAHLDCVFPQPPYNKRCFNDPDDQITLLGNPSIFRCDNLNLGCCSMDVLRHLSCEEMSRVPAGTTSDRMTRLASHILGQRSFYPLFPPPPGTSLDLSLMPEALSIAQIPDILILPSDLAPFVKVLSLPPQSKPVDPASDEPISSNEEPVKCLCINPGRLTKGSSGGTFTELLVLPDTTSEGSDASTPVTSRSKVVIKRI